MIGIHVAQYLFHELKGTQKLDPGINDAGMAIGQYRIQLLNSKGVFSRTIRVVDVQVYKSSPCADARNE